MTTNGDLKHDEKADIPRLTESPDHFDDDEDGIIGRHDEELHSETDEETDEDEDDEADDEDEPALKYERIGGSIPDLLKKDTASALSIANKLMVRQHFSPPLQILNLMSDRLLEHIAGLCTFSTSTENE